MDEVITQLAKLLGPLSTLRKDRRELKDLALRTISNALIETSLYYRDIKNGSPRDKEREAVLSKAWAAAAIPIRHFNDGLAITCEKKAEYWVNPENYNQKEIEKLGIKLEYVRNTYRDLLKPSFRLIRRGIK